MFKNQNITLEYIGIVKELPSKNWNELFTKLEHFAKQYENDEENELIRHECEGMKAHILEEMGKYDEALEIKLRHLSEMEVTDPSYPTKLGFILNLYHKLNRGSEAIKILEDYLDKCPNIPNGAVIYLLGIYMNVLEGTNEELPAKYRGYVEKFALEIDAKDFKVENLNDALKELNEYKSKGQMRLVQMMNSIEKLDRDEKLKIIKEFIENEPVGLFREIATEKLNKI